MSDKPVVVTEARRPGPEPSLSLKDQLRLAKDYADGRLTAEAIAEKYAITRTSVYRYLKRLRAAGHLIVKADPTT